MNRTEKELVVQNFKKSFSESQVAFIVDYQGCDCNAITKLRAELRASGAGLFVIKNTLAKIVLEDASLKELKDSFIGPSAIIWVGEDPVTPAKIISKFAKEQELFKLKSGMVDGVCIDSKKIEELSNLPSKEELYCKLLSLINAPAVRLLQTINAPAGELCRLLEAWKNKIV